MAQNKAFFESYVKKERLKVDKFAGNPPVIHKFSTKCG